MFYSQKTRQAATAVENFCATSIEIYVYRYVLKISFSYESVKGQIDTISFY